MRDSSDEIGAPRAVSENVDAIRRVEEEVLGRRLRYEALLEALGSFVGTPWFVGLHAVVVVIWVVVNAGLIPALAPFDRYPYTLMSTAFSVEAVLLVAFVLMKQNRMSEMADRRAHLDLQVNLLTEREASKALQLLQKLCEKHGIHEEIDDPETRELARMTHVGHFVSELEKRLPGT